MRLFTKTLVITFLSIIIIFLPLSAKTIIDCSIFDQWFLSDGAERFDYQVVNGQWNLPDDIQSLTTLTLRDTSIWEYLSETENAKYFIVFLTLEPDITLTGQHNICVYSLSNLN